MEIWKDIIGFEGLYQVSNFGRIKSLPRQVKTKGGSLRTVGGRILSCGHQSKTEHQIITLSKSGRIYSFPLHRIVALAFIPNPQNLPIINHIDEDPTNNRADNLEWCTHRYNINYRGALSRRTQSRTKLIECIETNEVHSASEWSEILGVCRDSMYNHLRGAAKSLKSLHFRFLN